MVDSVANQISKKRKKQKTAGQAVAGPSKSSSPTGRLFAPFRALGYVTNHIPFAMFVHATKGALAKPTVNIVTSVGKSWMMWDAAKMTLVFVGKECKEEIQALAVTGSEVYAVAGSRIFSYVRGKEVSDVREVFKKDVRADDRPGCTKHLTELDWARSCCLAISFLR
jgi:U3 small nucleolar RNA-associated protein 21